MRRRKQACRALPNLARTLQARDKSRIALRAHQPIHSIKNESSRILFYSMNWLGLQDSNLRMTGPKPVALPLGEGPIYRLF